MFNSKVPEIADYVEKINALIPNIKSGSLRFFDHWFGRPYDNCHTVVGVHGDNTMLIIKFDGNETLTVWSPEGIQISDTTFRIDFANQVLWQLYYYGRNQTPENLFSIEYFRDDEEIRVETDNDWFKVPKVIPNLGQPAIRMYGIYDS